LRSAAIDDIKTAIQHDACCHDLKKLSDNVISANAKVQQQTKDANAKWDAEHPIILDESAEGYQKEGPLRSSRGFWSTGDASSAAAAPMNNAHRNKMT
jgi:hypothetical protein